MIKIIMLNPLNGNIFAFKSSILGIILVMLKYYILPIFVCEMQE